MLSYVLVVLVAILNILNISFYKTGITQAGGLSMADLTNPPVILAKILTTPLLLCGFASSVCTTLLWLATLTRLPANVALPMMNGIFYVLLLFVSTLFLGEDLGIKKLAAIALILAGAFLLMRA
jgi:multidrug transporter EmrE-like cation transporter